MANRDFKKIERIMKDFSAKVGEGSPIEAGTGIKITGEDTKTISIDESVVAKKSDIGNGEISIYQGGIYKGGFKLNQKADETIELDLGATEAQIRTLGSILAEGYNKTMAAGIVNYEGLRNLVKQHFSNISLSEDCYLIILPSILSVSDVFNPEGVLSIHYWYNSCNGYYAIEINTNSVYGRLSSQTNLEIENDVDLYGLVDYLYENSINTEITVLGSSGHVTGKQINALCVNTIRYQDMIDSSNAGEVYEYPVDTADIIRTIFTSTAS